MYKVGDKVRVIVVDRVDKDKGIQIGDVLTVAHIGSDEEVFVDYKDRPNTWLHAYQLELVQLAEATQFNFIYKAQITEHLDKVISIYEEYCNDLLKECSTKYKEDYIDLKETGYEYRLELDKILVEVEDNT